MLFASAGAGLLAKGVSALFSGATREKRQERRYQRQAERAAKKEAIKSAITGSGYGSQLTAESSEVTDVATGGKDAAKKARDNGKKTNIGELVSKYWWVGLIALFLFGGGGNLLKPKRTTRRRRSSPAKTRTVYRYRTRKASPPRKASPQRRKR